MAEVERAALGSAAEAYRVLVVVGAPDADASMVAVATDLVGQRRPAEVVLTRSLPYAAGPARGRYRALRRAARDDRAMAELAELAEPVRARGIGAQVLARFSADPARDIAAQAAAAGPDLLVSAGPDLLLAGPDGVCRPGRQRRRGTTRRLPFRAGSGRRRVLDSAVAAVRVAGQLAAGQGVPLVVQAGPRVSRPIATAVAELRRHGLAVQVGGDPPTPCLVVAPDGAEVGAAHLLVRG